LQRPKSKSMLNRILIIILLSITNSVFASDYKILSSTKDTLKTEIVKDKVFVLHKVQAGQTLYSLVRMYNSTMTEVMAANPVLNNQVAIKVNQVLYFPLMKNGKQVTAKAFKREEKASKKEITDKKGIHEVSAGETVYSISRKYNIDISDFVEANGIEENKLGQGQKLIIDPEEIKKVLKSSVLDKPKFIVLEQIAVGKKITQEGVAEVINTTNRSNNYLALHRTAPVGSIIKITNEANGASITAKVVGNLSETGPDQEILVKLSPYAYYKLKPKDSKIRAEVVYFETAK
jgi:LysM repeat protein